MPDERQLRTIAAASLAEQKEVWKAHKPSKGDPQVSWWSLANGLAKTRMYPDAWEAITGIVLAPGQSWKKDPRLFYKEHASDWIVISAIRSDQHPGFTEVVDRKAAELQMAALG